MEGGKVKPIMLRLDTRAQRRAIEKLARQWRVSLGAAVRRALVEAKYIPAREGC